MQLQIFGAAGTVTGSCSLLTTHTGQQILIDFGMFQGLDVVNQNYVPLGFDAKTLSAALVTHAHLDHCGRLPLLVKNGYSGKIYMTQATKLLVELALMDAVKVAAHNHPDHPQLYLEEDVQRTIRLVEPVAYDQTIFPGKTEITFKNAGHILGSASIEIFDGEKRIIFSGDIGNPQQKLLQPASYLSSADVVVMESTYGNRLHPQENAREQLAGEIAAIAQTKGVLLLPAFALDRTQVLLYLLKQLKQEEKIPEDMPVFLDSPMAIHATAIYTEYKDLWNDALKAQTNPFSFPGLTYTREAKDSENISKVAGPKIIIAGNGMMTGGRIWHHLINYLPVVTTRLVVVGYQGEGTLGRKILDGEKNVPIYHEQVLVNATITNIEGLSAHADQKQLVLWVQAIQKVKQVFLIHGEENERKALAEQVQTTKKDTQVLLPVKAAVYTV